MNFLKNISKPFKWVILSLLTLIILVFLLISPILEYVIEKNSKEWTGRQILMDDLSLNLFTGVLELENIRMYEKDDSTVFVSSGMIGLNATIYKMIGGNYAVESVTIDSLFVDIRQSNSGFNFDDLIPPADTAAADTASEPIEYEVRNIVLSNSIIDYSNSDFSNRVTIRGLKVHSGGLAWNEHLISALFDFKMGDQGSVSGDVEYDMNNGVYNMNVLSKHLDLSPIDPFIKDIMAIDTFGGLLSCDMAVKGSSENPTDVALNGILWTENLYMTGPKKDTLLSVGDFTLSIDTINLKNNTIDLRTMTALNSYIKFEMFDNGLNNFTALMAPDSAAGDSAEAEMEMSNPFTLISEYAQALREEYNIDSYSIDTFLIDESRILFKDYTLHETFVYDISQLKIWSNNFNSKNKRVEVEATALLNGRGHAEVLYAFDPADMLEMDLYYRITDMSVTDISPYSVFYVAHPFWEGDVTMESSTNVKSKILHSDNKLLIERIKVGSKSNRPALFDMPLKLAIAILKDPKGNIDLEIPVDGDLNDPNYHYGKIIWSVIKNLLIKAATAPYKLIAGMFGGNPEDLREVSFDYMQIGLGEKQLNQLKPIVKMLENKKDVNVTFRQFTEPGVENEQVASLNARRMYWHSRNGGAMTDSLTRDQEMAIESLSIKDSMFVVWVDSIVGPSPTYIPIQEKVIKVCGHDNVNIVKRKLQDSRNRSVMNFFISEGADTSRVKVFTEDPAAIPPQETRSKFLIEYGAE